MSDFWSRSDNLQKQVLDELYHGKQLSWAAIAEELDTYPNRIRRIANKLGVKSRDKSDAQKVALSSGRQIHPTKGKQTSDETKIRISEAQGKVWDSLSEEDREVRSRIGKDAWDSKTDAEKEVFHLKSRKAIHIASKEGSKTERFILEELLAEGFSVQQHKEAILQNERFHIDLYVPECRAAIEIDGAAHFEPVYGEERLNRRMAADIQKNGLILSSGMVLIRVQLKQRPSQRYNRSLRDQLVEILNGVKQNFPEENKRYFKV